jgi:hypothetical protein
LKKILILTIGLAVWLSVVGSERTEANCETETTGWTQAYEALEQAMESYRRLKEESITPRIQEELEKTEPGRSIARGVQEVLKARTRLLGDAKTKCLELAQSERSVYDEWRRCAGSGGGRRRNPNPQGPDSVARQRSGLLASLQDLLLDEAYVQYRNYRDPSPASYSFDQTPYMGGQNSWRPQRQMGADPYQGYFR